MKLFVVGQILQPHLGRMKFGTGGAVGTTSFLNFANWRKQSLIFTGSGWTRLAQGEPELLNLDMADLRNCRNNKSVSKFDLEVGGRLYC